MKASTILLASFAIVAICSSTKAQAEGLIAGAGKVEITPPARALSAGDRIVDRLYARAVVISDHGRCAVIVGVDQGGLRDALVKPATERASKIAKCPAENFVISATHTHSGSTGGLGGAGEPTAKTIENAIVTAVESAKAAMRPARIGYATADVHLNVNRDYFVDGRWLQGPNVDGKSDKTLAVVDLLDARGNPIAVYMNYAMHPVNFYHSGVISGDFAGAASRYVEQHYGPRTVAIFAQGASGDQNPRLQRPERQLISVRTHSPAAKDQAITAPPPWQRNLNERNPVARDDAQMAIPIAPAEQVAYDAAIENTVQLVEAMGTIIGESAIQAMIDQRALADTAEIRGAQRAFQCPGRDRLDRDNAVREGVLPPYADGAPVNLKVGMLRIGDIYIATVNGEVYSDIAARLKREAPVRKLMMTTLANGAANSGYIYSNEASPRLTFQVISSRLKPGCAEDGIVNASLGLIGELSR
ncbi:neutral/alkaline non-lysosomal ceramidase N-terminal domain-containing protein [Sphingomonas sp. BIUV-7]|uniref:Neutral ceramidase n=1 Tax=Sphingomonas natans TaxID=3063330 RepID=A0ABT8Y8S3_9SPHN|nr:neutral/alkaline non-lysosomal ceramidase N-terminal domain-containing protein [Sphingomonas sp. BIUV-7]MDO6414725.1 neutral/alkaline non-lysosomal ceramidase N-terminal domain-containing protein [Sphingomonas sp. BIUV-7]